MARIRSVKPEFWDDRKLAKALTRDERLLYIALWNHSDEHGRCRGDARWIKGHCLPYDDDLNLAAIDRMIDNLATAGRVIRYEVDGDPFLHLPKLGDHQRLEPAKVASKIPPPPSAPTSQDPAQIFSDEVARDAESSAQIVALHVAGSREHVAGSMEHVGAEKPARASDDLWDALLDACQIDPATLTSSARGSYNAARKQLADVGATPRDVRDRAANYRAHFPRAPLTPPALAKQWAQCALGPPRPAARLSTTDERLMTGKALVEHYEALESGA